MKSFVNIFLIASSLFVFSTGASSAPLQTWIGNQRAAVVLMEWADNSAQVSRQTVVDTFFGEKNLSLREYFLENSTNKFSLTGQVFDWKKVDQKWNPDRGCNPDWISKMAVNLFSSELKVADFDSDHNGKIDHLFVVHSGRISHDRVGPDCVFGKNSLADHTIVFQSQGVGSQGTAIPIGFYLHEAGHLYFSFPDLYADHYHGQYGIGMWGIMGLGAWGVSNQTSKVDLFRFPAHFEPLSKIEMGWVKPLVITKSQKEVRIHPVEISGEVVKISTGFGQGSSYYLEYRSKTGFSANHRGHGLLIWRGYELIQADGKNDLNHGKNLGYRPLPPIDENFGDENDPFPGGLNVTDFRDPKTGLSINHIHDVGDAIVFDVEIGPSNFEEIFQFPIQQMHFNGTERL